MRIVSLRTAVLRRAYDGSLRNTRHAWNAKHYVLVELETDTGLRGYGEMYCDGGGAPGVAVAMLREELAPHVVGHDALRPAALAYALQSRMALSARGSAATCALSAVDIAAWDLLGKACGRPLHELLGGATEGVSVYASGGMYGEGQTPGTIAAEMAAAQRAGLAGAKIKVGGATLEEDLERLARTREAIGAQARLMADAMFQPSVPQAVALGRAASRQALHFLEAPTAMDDAPGWREIRNATGVPLAGPELSASLLLMRSLVETSAVDFLQYDLAIAGGITVGQKLAAFAAVHRRPVTLHCAASAIAMAAAAHLGTAIGNCDSLEFHVMHDGLRERLWSSGWRLRDGRLLPSPLPGLGVALGEDDLALFSE